MGSGGVHVSRNEQRTLAEIRDAGLRALERELGPVDLARFLQQFEHGSGDYSLDRHHRPSPTVAELQDDWRRTNSDPDAVR
jgi:hypothetical protein